MGEASLRAWLLPLRLLVGAKPVSPETSGPCVTIKRTHSKDTPLLCLPCRVEPKGLREHAKDASPPSPICALVLRKPDRHHAAKCDAKLIYAHGTPSLWRHTFVRVQPPQPMFVASA